jgi:hypothetical protein
MPVSHLSADDIDRYLARTLDPAALLAMEDHLEECPECRRARRQAASRLVPVVPFLADAPEIYRTEEEERKDAAVAAVPPRRQWVVWIGVAAAVELAVMAGGWWTARHKPVPPEIVASLNDAGGKIEFAAAGGLRGGAFTAEQQQWIREVFQRRSLPRASGVEPPLVLRSPVSSTSAFALLAPVYITVLSDRPIFEWTAYPGAIGYEVLVTNEGLDPVARSGRITATRWQPSDPLPREVRLLWQVRAYRGANFETSPKTPDPPASFTVVGQADAASIERLRAAPHPSHLLLAVVCSRAGLSGEARRELDALQAENPGSPLVQELIKTVAAR